MPAVGTQNRRVLDVFLARDGGWISARELDRQYGFTQIHTRMKELKEKFGWPIERSAKRGEYGFYSYRILQETKTLQLL